MATLAFAAAGAAVGSAVMPAGLSVFGTTLAGATIGAQVGALAGSFVDQALFGTGGQNRTFEGPRLDDLRVTSLKRRRAHSPHIRRRPHRWTSHLGNRIRRAARDPEGGGQSKGGSGGGGGTTK